MDVKKIQNAIQWMKNGGLVIVADDEDRESEDMIGIGSKVTPENVNFMTKYARGLLCTSVGREVAERLKLPQMESNNTDPYGTAFTISVDYKTTTTGISAYDRAATIKAIPLLNLKTSSVQVTVSHWLLKMALFQKETATPKLQLPWQNQLVNNLLPIFVKL